MRLPHADVTRAVAEPPPPEGFEQTRRQRRVLLVDDNDDARVLLAELLLAVGHDVRAATDAASALAMLETFSPEVAILDIGLPVMDGYELAARLRRELAAPPRLIALTGYGRPNDIVRSKEAGFDVHLVKPVEIRKLFSSLEGDGDQPAGESAATAWPEARRPGR